MATPQSEQVSYDQSAAVLLFRRADEQARSAIRRTIRTTLARLELHDSEVAYELRTTIRTGPTYRYEPDVFRPVEWRLGSEQHSSRRG